MNNCDICKLSISENYKFFTWIEDTNEQIIIKLKKNKIVCENNIKCCTKCIYNKRNIQLKQIE